MKPKKSYLCPTFTLVIVLVAGCPAYAESGPAASTPVCYNDYGETVSCPTSAAAGDAVYRDNGDQSVTDLRTNLRWENVEEAQVGTYPEGENYCESLGLAGFSDWRIPDHDELMGIADYGRSQNIINGVFACEEGNYWTVTPHGGDAGHYMTVGFFVGDNSAYDAEQKFLVRCVRNDG